MVQSRLSATTMMRVRTIQVSCTPTDCAFPLPRVAIRSGGGLRCGCGCGDEEEDAVRQKEEEEEEEEEEGQLWGAGSRLHAQNACGNRARPPSARCERSVQVSLLRSPALARGRRRDGARDRLVKGVFRRRTLACLYPRRRLHRRLHRRFSRCDDGCARTEHWRLLRACRHWWR